MKTVNDRLRELRLALGLSQEAIGAQGFASAANWAKIERGARSPSDILIGKITEWLVTDGYVKKADAQALEEELLALKYMGDLSPFVRRLATDYYAGLEKVSVPVQPAKRRKKTSK